MNALITLPIPAAPFPSAAFPATPWVCWTAALSAPIPPVSVVELTAVLGSASTRLVFGSSRRGTVAVALYADWSDNNAARSNVALYRADHPSSQHVPCFVHHHGREPEWGLREKERKEEHVSVLNCLRLSCHPRVLQEPPAVAIWSCPIRDLEQYSGKRGAERRKRWERNEECFEKREKATRGKCENEKGEADQKKEKRKSKTKKSYLRYQ